MISGGLRMRTGRCWGFLPSIECSPRGDFLVLVSVVMAADKRHYALVYNSEGR